MTIAVAGCVAQAEGEEILRRARQVDLVVGPQAYHRLPDLLRRVEADRGSGVVDTEFPVETKFDRLPEEFLTQGPSAFLTVQEGCDKFCSFCVVPYTRGAEFSRPVQAVVGEARRMVAGGAKEITLLGQNVNAYHGADAGGAERGLGHLIAALAGINGLERIRYTTSHPRDMDDELIAAHRDVDALMPFLHLPVQSGSDRVLGAMNRRHTAADYRRVVDRLRTARPDLALSSDFIVGHPGEDDDDFRRTLDLVRDIEFAQAYSFKYSPRPGTPAADRPQVDDEVKTARLAALQEVLNAQQKAFNEAAVGRRMDVLLERPGRRPGQLVGRSPHMQAVHVAATEDLLGSLVSVVIRSSGPNSLSGEVGDVASAGNPTDVAPTSRAVHEGAHI